MRIGVLKTDALKPEFVANYGEYPDMFARRLKKVDPTIELVTYDVQLGEYPDSVDDVDAYIITGSKSSVYDDDPWILQLIEFVRALHASCKPLIGVCFGHQLVAHALGGKTAQAPQGWQVGVKQNNLHAGARALGMEADCFYLVSSHRDQVLTPASGAEVLASTSHCPVAMTRLGNHIITSQGHPEFDKGFARDILDMRREILGEQVYLQALQSLEKETDNEQVLRWMLDFIRAR